jgi:hypothetical protein
VAAKRQKVLFGQEKIKKFLRRKFYPGMAHGAPPPLVFLKTARLSCVFLCQLADGRRYSPDFASAHFGIQRGIVAQAHPEARTLKNPLIQSGQPTEQMPAPCIDMMIFLHDCSPQQPLRTPANFLFSCTLGFGAARYLPPLIIRGFCPSLSYVRSAGLVRRFFALQNLAWLVYIFYEVSAVYE